MDDGLASSIKKSKLCVELITKIAYPRKDISRGEVTSYAVIIIIKLLYIKLYIRWICGVVLF